MPNRFSIVPLILFVLGFAQLAEAAEPIKEPAVKESTPAKAQTAAEQAIRKVATDFDQAFNAGDAEKVAALWAADAEYVDEDGSRYAGRDTIKKEYAAFFADNPRSKIRSAIDSVQIVNGTTAVEDGRAMIEPPPAGAPGSSRYTALYVLQEGKWLLSSVHDIRVAKPSNYRQLDDFEWMIGTWHGGNGKLTTETQCRWLANKSFIERTYKVMDAGMPASSGVQIIGWDPEQRQIRSWTFSSDAGHAQNVWKPEANGWSMQTSGVLGDGTKTTSVNSLRRVDDDTLAWKSTDRTVGDVRLPDLQEVILKRGAEKH